MIYYPISTLLLAGIKDILIISSPEHLPLFQTMLQDGAQWGAHFTYRVQPSPGGLAQALIIGESFIGQDQVCLALGDNIFHGHQLGRILAEAKDKHQGVTLFASWVKNPEQYGVLELDEMGHIVAIEEKPKNPKSHYAVTGLYMYDPDVVEIAKSICPSKRGELEITDVNQVYVDQKRVNCEILHRGFSWLDMGTPSSLLQAAQYVALLSNRQGIRIMSPEEIAWRSGYIDHRQLLYLANQLMPSDYGQYLHSLVEPKYQNFLQMI
jgi:glucose-1-phosphate thymidylyltransferase